MSHSRADKAKRAKAGLGLAYSIHLHHQTEIRLVQLAGCPIKKKEWIALKQNKVFNNSFFSASILVLLFFFKKEFRFSRIPRRASARSSLLVLLRPRLVGKPTRHTYIGGLTKRLILWSVHVFRIPEAVFLSVSIVKSISRARGTSTSSS